MTTAPAAASAVRIEGSAPTYRLTGSLTFATVAPLTPPAGATAIDLSGLLATDSAGLALLLEWWRQAKADGRPLAFTAPPPRLRDLIRVNGLDSVFGVS